MYGKKKTTGTAMTLPAGIGLALLISMLITLAGSALVAIMVLSEKIGEGAVGYAAMAILALSSVAGAWIAVILVKRLRLQVSIIFGGCYYLLLLAMTALLFGGQYQGMGTTAIIILVGSALVAFLPATGTKTGKRKKVAYR